MQGLAASALLVAHCTRRIDAYASQRREGRATDPDLTATIGLCFCAVFGLLGGRPGTFVKVWRVPPTSPLAPLGIAAARLLQKGV